jgi:hypothetical protein
VLCCCSWPTPSTNTRNVRDALSSKTPQFVLLTKRQITFLAYKLQAIFLRWIVSCFVLSSLLWYSVVLCYLLCCDTVLFYVIFCVVIQCCFVLSSLLWYSVVLCYLLCCDTVLFCVIFCVVIPCCFVLSSVLWYRVVLCYLLCCDTMLFCVIFCAVIQCCFVSNYWCLERYLLG